MLGYAGRIARVDLTRGSVKVEEVPGWLIDLFIGGKGFVYGLLSRELSPGVDALSPGNKIVIAAGALAGLAPAASKTIVGAVSPLSGLIHDTSVGEWFSYFLRGAGFDALIIEGASKEPVYLWVHDGMVEIRDASRVWGKSTRDAVKLIREETNRAASVMVIGPAGENMVKIANVMVDGERAGGRGGLGAVFGAKGLKAVSVYGIPRIEVADRDRLRRLFLEVYERFRTTYEAAEHREYGTNNGLVISGTLGVSPAYNYGKPKLSEEESHKLSGYAIKELEVGFPGKPIKIVGSLCPVKCSRWVRIPGEDDFVKPEYEKWGLLGAAVGVFDKAVVLKAMRIADDLGLDAIGAGNVIAWAMDLYEHGLLNKDETGLELRFGNGEAVLKLLEDMAYRRGFGALLADGVADAVKRLGRGSEYAVHIKNLALPAWYPNGPLRGLVISYLTADVGASHLRGWPEMHSEDTPLKNTVESMINDRDHKAVMDSMGLCVFNPYKWDDVAEFYAAATGRKLNKEQLARVSVRIDTIARIWHVLLGYVDPWSEIPHKMIHDPNGPRLRRDEVMEALREFYRLRGWDTETGMPSEEYLRDLGLDWMIPLRNKALDIISKSSIQH
jgi:aldehyde:ferredoxin oxidoreductase